MKLITAIIRPHKLEDVRNALDRESIASMTITEVKGCGRQKGHVEIYRGAEYDVQLIPKIKLEVIVRDDQVDNAVEIIGESSRTGRVGDGKIFVFDLDKVVRVRTGETDNAAL